MQKNFCWQVGKIKMLWMFVFIVLFTCKAVTQDTINISIVNQYKSKVPLATVKVNNLDFITDKSGTVSISKFKADSILIIHEGYKEKHVALSELLVNRQVIMEKKFSWTDLLTPMFYIIYGGIWLLLFIIFAETGLFIGFFLPGDSLLFVAGILSTTLVDSISLNTGSDFLNLLIISGLCTVAGILGNTVGYITGRKVGPAMFGWRDRFFFKKKYLYQAKEFYEKHGGSAIILARFLPFIRTFAPIVAGIVHMEKKKFGFFNMIGCVAWVVSMLFIGHYLNNFTKTQFGFDLEKHLEVIVIGIVLVTTAPVLIKLFLPGKKRNSTV